MIAPPSPLPLLPRTRVVFCTRVRLHPQIQRVAGCTYLVSELPLNTREEYNKEVNFHVKCAIIDISGKKCQEQCSFVPSYSISYGYVGQRMRMILRFL